MGFRKKDEGKDVVLTDVIVSVQVLVNGCFILT